MHQQNRHDPKQSTDHQPPEQQAAASSSIPILSGDSFEQLGLSLIGHASHGAHRTTERRFVSHFGINSQLVSIVWRELHVSGWLRFSGRKPKPEHLLWCLFFLGNYNVEEVNAGFAGTSESFFCYWVWFYAEGIANLDKKFVRNFSVFQLYFYDCLNHHLTLCFSFCK
jgi:hypothetical protein